MRNPIEAKKQNGNGEEEEVKIGSSMTEDLTKR